MASACPACGADSSVALPEPYGPAAAPVRYQHCLNCTSIFAPELLAQPLAAEDWARVPRPPRRASGASALVRPLRGVGAVALVGRADLDLLRELSSRGHPVAGCDTSAAVAAEGAAAGLDVKRGTPAQIEFADRFDLVVVEGLLEYAADPLAELVAVRHMVRAGGRARLETCAARGLAAEQMGPGFSLYAPPAVRTLYSFDGLTMLASRAGFRSVSLVRRPARASRWLFTTQPYESEMSRRLARFADGMRVPASVFVVTARAD